MKLVCFIFLKHMKQISSIQTVLMINIAIYSRIKSSHNSNLIVSKLANAWNTEALHLLLPWPILHWSAMVRTKQRHHKELHHPLFAMQPIMFPAGKVVRPPVLQHKLETLTASLSHRSHLLRPAEVACHEAPKIWQQVHTVRKCCLAWRIILEHCNNHHIIHNSAMQRSEKSSIENGNIFWLINIRLT